MTSGIYSRRKERLELQLKERLNFMKKRKYEVMYSYTILVEANNALKAEEDAAKLFIEMAPRTYEMNIQVTEI